MSFSHRRFLFAVTGGVETFHIDAHMLHLISFCCEISQIPLHPNPHTSNHPHFFALQCRLGFDFVPQFNADVSNYVAIHLLPSPWRISCQYLHITPTEDIRMKSSTLRQISILRVSGRKHRPKEKFATSAKFWGVHLLLCGLRYSGVSTITGGNVHD
jgi:hypothetical protein